MKIKTVKKLRLDELIKYIRENEIKVTEYVNNVGGIASFSYGQLSLRGESNFIDIESPFKVPVEEELTEETEFEELWEVYYNKSRDDVDAYKNGKMNGVTSTSISQILEENSIDYENVTLAIFHKDTLIWSKDTGIPAEGVIEA